MTFYLGKREKAIWTAINLALLAAPHVVSAIDRLERERVKFKHLVTGCTGPFSDISDETYVPFIGPYGSEHHWVRCQGCGRKAWLPETVIATNMECSA